MRQLILIILLAIPQVLSAQADRADSLHYLGRLLEAKGDRDGALGYYSRSIDMMAKNGEVRSERFWEVAQRAATSVLSLYNTEKALRVTDDFLAYLADMEPVTDCNGLTAYLKNAQAMAFSCQNYGKSIHYGHWLICQMEASTQFRRQEYYQQCLWLFDCYRLAHRPMEQCYNFLIEYGERCRRLTGAIPPDFVERQVLLDIDNHFYASALQNISGLREFYRLCISDDTVYYTKHMDNLLQGSRLFASTNQCDKALEYLAELSNFIEERGIDNSQILFDLHFQHGLVYKLTRRSAEALESFSNAIRCHTDPPDCYDQQIECFIQQAYCHEQEGDFLKALTLSTKACRYSSVNKSLKSADLELKCRIAYLFYKAWLGNKVDYQALLDFGNRVAERNDPAISADYVNAIARVFPKYGDPVSLHYLMTLLYRMQIDDITLKLTQLAEDERFPSIERNVDINHLMFSLSNTSPNTYNDMLYNLCLAYKGCALSSIRRLGSIIDARGDTRLKQLHSRVKRLKQEHTRLSAAQPDKADSVRRLLEGEENLLIRKTIETCGNYLAQTTWEDVSNKLDSNDIAIEFLDYRKVLSNLQYEKGNSYGALVVSPRFTMPVYIELFNDTIFRNCNIAALHSGKKSQLVKEKILAPVLKHAVKGGRIYYSPSGIIHNIALENLFSIDGEIFGLRYKFRRVSSTSEVISADETITPHSALLFGDIDYNSPQGTFKRGFRSIPGTKTEIDNIERRMLSQNIEASKITQRQATEETFKSLSTKGYDIIHLATHGFFHKDSALVENPLLRSGLALAGANRAWNGERIPNGIDDGILTAQEIKDLDLSKTQMVVLSACETGLGDINTDGVFGLQRAFKSAGVQTIVMSLWKVSDNATSLLMTEFYRVLLASGDRHTAFVRAKEAVRARFPEAYYWAGWVMLD